MYKIHSLILFAFLLQMLPATAQTTGSPESRYRLALQDYKSGKYTTAMEKMAALTRSTEPGSFTPYAHYYYALSAFQLKRYRESRQMLVQLQSRYPGWTKSGDVHYLLGAVSFETGQYKEGLDFLSRIKESSLNKDVQSLKQYGLGKMDDLAKLKELQKAFPEDKDVALALIVYIENAQRSTATDVQLAEQLEKQFKISRKDKSATAQEAPKRSTPRSDTQWTKGYLDVAVLLPFRLDEAANAKRRSNQFAYDYYLGLKLAKDQLATEGVTVNLWAYDVSNDDAVMQLIAGNRNFQQSDLVIGPLYPATFDVAADFMAGSQGILLNPLSTDGNLLKASSNIYLGHPSIAYQTQRAAEWMKTQVPAAPVVIFHGNTAKDSSMASSYAAEWKRLGGTVTEIMKVQPDREWLESKVNISEQNKPGHIAIFSSDGASGTNLLELLNARKLNALPAIAKSTSFNMQQSRLARYGSRLFLIEGDYVDREKESIRTFQRSYYNMANTFPSVYSYQGYDQLMFFARMLHDNKDKTSDALRKQKFENDTFLLSGFNYTKGNENQITPVLRYNGTKWVPVDKF